MRYGVRCGVRFGSAPPAPSTSGAELAPSRGSSRWLRNSGWRAASSGETGSKTTRARARASTSATTTERQAVAAFSQAVAAFSQLRNRAGPEQAQCGQSPVAAKSDQSS